MNQKDELPLALRAAYHGLHRQSDMQFAEHGITADQFVLLATLARGNALTQRELASRMPSDRSQHCSRRAGLTGKKWTRLAQHSPDRWAGQDCCSDQGRTPDISAGLGIGSAYQRPDGQFLECQRGTDARHAPATRCGITCGYLASNGGRFH